MPNNKYAFFNGAIVPIEQARVSVMTNGLNYGTGCFEGIRGYWNPDEAFFCGTGVESKPIVEIDRRPAGDGQPGPIAT